MPSDKSQLKKNDTNLTMTLLKSHIQAHLRRYRSGKVAHVVEHEDSRSRKDLQPGTAVYFRTAEGKRSRRGHVISAIDGGYHIQGRREAGKFTAPKYRVPHADIWTQDEQVAKRQSSSGKFEMLSSTKRVISVAENNRRALVGYERLGKDEKEIVTHPAVREMKLRTLKKLAAQNGIVPQEAGIIDADFADMHSSYVMGLINALRHETSKAPDEDLREFKDHLKGKRNDSRIFMTITFAGRNSAKSFIIDRNKKRKELIDFQSGAGLNDEEGHVDYVKEFSVAPTQEEEYASAQRDEMIRGYLGKLPPVAREILNRKFALDKDIIEPQSDAKIATELNRLGTKYQGKYTWTRNNVAEALRSAIHGLLKMEGVDHLKDFWKACREHITLMKAKKTFVSGKG